MTTANITLPLLIPMKSPRNRKVLELFKLIYTDGPLLIVYYSCQHPIAFLTNKTLYTRPRFWDRRRKYRKDHAEAITEEVKTIVPDVEILSTNNFERILTNILGTDPNNRKNTTTPQDSGQERRKRKILI